MKKFNSEHVEFLNNELAPEIDFTSKPIEYLNYLYTRTFISFRWEDSKRIKELIKFNYNANKERYKFNYEFNWAFDDFIREKIYYGEISLPKSTPLTILWDDHGSLQTVLQCDCCGTIIHIDDSDESCLMRAVCPVCNKLEDKKYPFRYVTIKEKSKWINQMLFAEIVDGDSYMGGRYQQCKFKPTNFEKCVTKTVNRITNFYRGIKNGRF